MQRTLKQDAINQVFTVNGKKFQYVVKTVEWFLCATKRIGRKFIYILKFLFVFKFH